MDTTILNLLFNYKGAITSREFRVGMAIVIMSMGAYIWSFLDTSLVNVIAGREGTSWLSTVVLYNQVANFFVPNLVPVLFVISSSSFILAMKRYRMLTNNRTIAIASGVLNYLFFASSMALIMLTMQMERGGSMQYYSSTLVSLLCVLFFIGGFNLVYLCIRKSSEPFTLPCSKGKLDVSGYAIKLGNLMWIAAFVGVLISIALGCVGKILLLSPIVPLVLGSCTVVLLFFYIRYSVYRLKDAGVSVLWLVCIIVVYLIMFGLKIWMNLYNLNDLTLYYNTIFSIASSFVILAQYALFLLPTKVANPVLNEDSNNNRY